MLCPVPVALERYDGLLLAEGKVAVSESFIISNEKMMKSGC